MQPIQNRFYQERHQNLHDFYSQSSCPQPRYNQGMPHAYPTPSFVPLPQASMLPFPPCSNPSKSLSPVVLSEPSASPSDCSVCLASRQSSLTILQPSKHPLCSACSTSELNTGIVGEKDMQCAVCKQSVADFKIFLFQRRDGRFSF